jgi:outer membrane protein assembly factor BamB
MNHAVFRNIAIVSAIFILVFSSILIINYFQVRESTPLKTEVIKVLKDLNDVNANNPDIQEQIRQLDLMSRKAYFTNINHLKTGSYILLGSVIAFFICVRLYFSNYKNIPEKEISPIDDWIIKTQARKYIVWITSGVVGVALAFVLISSPHLKVNLYAEKDETEPKIGQTSIANDTISQNIKIEQLTETVEVAENVEDTAIVENEEIETIVADKKTEKDDTEKAYSGVSHNAFRGNYSNGISFAKNIPTNWNLNEGTNILWKKDIPQKGYNSPVINGNKIFFSGADETSRKLYCYDLTTGKQQWVLAAEDIPGSPAQVPKTTDDTGLAASSVTTNGKQVCAIFGTGDILCADINGNTLWSKNLGVPDNHYGYSSSLLIYNNMLIVQYDNRNTSKVVAFDVASGNEIWSRNRNERITWSSPILAKVGKQFQLVLMGNPSITAYNPSNGEQLWRVESLSGEVGASACSYNDVVFGATEYAKLVAIDGHTGKVLWETNEYLPEVASPVASQHALYMATSYGVFASFDTKSGALLKEHDLGSEFYSSPMIVDGKIYLFGTEGNIYIFSDDKEFNLLHSFETGEKTYSTPAFTDGKMIVRTQKSIYCVAKK